MGDDGGGIPSAMKQRFPYFSGWLVRYWFFVGIALVVPAAAAMPEAGVWLRRWHILKFGIFAVFLVTGLTIDLVQIEGARKNLTAIAASLLSSLTLFPGLVAVLGTVFFGGMSDFKVGALILSVAPVTIASGAVMTGIAGGNIPLSLFICIAGNIAAIFTVPFSLELMSQGQSTIVLPVVRMITNLFMIIIVPIAVGQLLRLRLKHSLAPFHTGFSVFSQCIVLMIIFNAVTGSAARLGSVGPQLGSLLLFVCLLHGVVLAMNFGISHLIRLDRAATAAFTIQTSQKTLTVSYLVWAGYFADAYPMAVMPAIGYHLTQMVADTLLAHRLRRWIHYRCKSPAPAAPTDN